MKSTTHRTEIAAMVGAALGAFAAPALALPPPPYAVVDLGYSMIGLESAGIEEEGVEPLGSDRRAIGFAISLGWRFTPHLAAEGTFLDLGEGQYDVAVPDGGSVTDAKIGVRSSGMLLSLAGTWPINEKLSLEGRAGAYFGKTETRVSGRSAGPLGGQTFDNVLGTDSKVGLAVGIGAVAALNDRWAVRAGYDYVDAAFGKDAGRISLGVRFNWP
jgi:opacity protein-like surface antigen